MGLIRTTDFYGAARDKLVDLISEDELREKSAEWLSLNEAQLIRCNHFSALFHQKHCIFKKDPEYNNGTLFKTCGDCDANRN